MWNQIDIAWLAGIIEGEGCINISKPNKGNSNYYARLNVKMTDYDVLAKAQRIFGGSIKGPEIQDRKKPAWSWQVANRKDLARILLAIVPLMGERRSAKILEAAYVLHEALRPRLCVYCDLSYLPVNSKQKYCPKCQIKKSGSARTKRAKEKANALSRCIPL